MTAYARCATCGEYGWASTHRCPPQWEWRAEGMHADGEWESGMRARDAEAAAAKAAENYDDDGCSLLNGNEVRIDVRDMRTGEVTRWECYGELVAVYHAQAAKEGD